MDNLQTEVMLFFSIAVNLLLVLLFTYLIRIYREQKNVIGNLEKNYNTVVSQKKSSEVRLGMIGEHMAPFLECWPYNPSNFRFLGAPVDGIQYNDDSIIFIEIKTGAARLSKSQRNIRDLIKEGKVYFETFRIDDSGAKLKREEA